MRLEFSREDLLVQIDKEKVSLVSGKVVDRFDLRTPGELGTALEKSAMQSTAVQRWAKRFPDAHYTLIYRICLDIRERKQQARNWEASLLQFMGRFDLRPPSRPPIIIMRVSPVRARSANIPFTLPLRLVEVDTAREYIRPALSRIFRDNPLEKYEAALRALKVVWKRWERFELPPGWPTAEVLHFNKLPRFPEGKCCPVTQPFPERSAGCLKSS
jgi:hypothetical protein